MHVMWVGPVGSGKTFNAVADALQDAGDTIATNMPLVDAAITDYLLSLPGGKRAAIYRTADGGQTDYAAVPAKVVNQWRDFADGGSFLAHCGTLLIDEAPLWLDARKYDSLSPEARMKIIEHRKDDLRIVSTAQDVAFIDKVFRTLCDEIRVVRMLRLPFIGWLWPSCVRPTIVCKDCGRVRRDGRGDDRGLFRLLGFGTAYAWDCFKAKDLIDAQDNTGDGVPEPRKLGSGMRLFDSRIAACYSTSMKLSDTAREAIAARGVGGHGRPPAPRRRAAAPEGPPPGETAAMPF